MNKKVLLFLALLTIGYSKAQELYFVTGTNFTKYNFEAKNSSMTTKLQSGNGTTHEIGYAIPIRNKDFSYSFGVTLDEYNALAGSTTNSYKWDTKYLGAQAALHYDYKVSPFFSVSARAGINLSSIIYGKQSIDGEIFDLKNQEEFSGLFLRVFGKIQTLYKLNKFSALSLGYGYSHSASTSNSTNEKLAFDTNQILFGIHFTTNY
ncbi:hypothetical protein NAT47_09105 [Flavobacterium sp. HXWNR69]|uniref:Outer membrane protein beta-barrel domain-containing protein n=1 Tax=Flavobacterium fragile TaxID=2949085 RepID=A0ABT0THX8_9FLAO|nr:hypothetical protein [Flavobacterium sp. HXWNR69]MCL9770576.1 hypothetical protein [Flavobacterium sp. HXWNR69]